MEVQSRLETILMTSVSTYFNRFMMWSLGWLITPTSKVATQTCHDIRIFFFHDEEEIDCFDDNQLSMLGLDVGAMNDKDGYWDYSTRNRR